ncbi:MAG: hypothetical protein QOF26_605 [Baekduia sp.]|jgi:ketosteroid isomerase-like protein|nr:hypothetical protein [Baekduia sp.]
MTEPADARSTVLHLVAAMDRGDADAYFDGLAPDVTFVLGREASPLHSRDECRAAFERWTAEGLRIEACRSWDLEVRTAADGTAVATHVLSFHVSGLAAPVRRRETLVLRRDGDERWHVVHAHRSPHPYEWAGGMRYAGAGAGAG